MEESDYQYQNKQNNRSKSKWAVIIGLVILVVAIIGVMLYMRQPKKTVENSNVVVTTAPTPTEKPKINKSTVKIQVVNGTGIAGQAGVVVKALTDAGYSIDNIKSTNADTYNNTITTVTGRTNFDDTINDIVSVLKPTFSDIAISSSKLDESSAFDIVVLTGSKITVTPTVSPTGLVSPTPTSTIAPTSTPIPSPTLSLTP